MITLTTASARLDGLILARDVAALNGSSRVLPRAVARGELVRIRRGVYVDAERWADADADKRYRMRVRAAALTRLVPLQVSHLSAAAMHRLPMVGTWPTVVHALTPGAPGGSSKHGIVTHSRVAPAAPVLMDDVFVTALERTLVDVAATAPATIAVPMIDHALRHGRTTRTQLEDVLREVLPGRGAQRAVSAVAFATSLADSPGESLSRVLIHELGFEAPELQVEFRVRGRIAIADFYWRSRRLIGEFDGRGKYEREEFTRGLTPGQTVWREKRREDELRGLGERVTRWTWELLLSPERFAAHLRDAGVPRAR